MNLFGWLQFAFYIVLQLALVNPLGLYMARVSRVHRLRVNCFQNTYEKLIAAQSILYNKNVLR
jgi:K+-transporting ATPase A subunit